MKKKVISAIIAALALALLAAMLSGCGKKNTAANTAEPASADASAATAEPAGSSEAEIVTARQDGERFEETIILEGMEETVHYEHIRNDTVGIEMDYDYESFVRLHESEWERFFSIYDNEQNPENFLELTRSTSNADVIAASVRASLSQEYKLLEDTRTLDRAGSCIRIEASEHKDGGRMAEKPQVVYIIPASDGCLVAIEHFSIESAEGFGRRFSYMLNTLSVIDRK